MNNENKKRALSSFAPGTDHVVWLLVSDLAGSNPRDHFTFFFIAMTVYIQFSRLSTKTQVWENLKADYSLLTAQILFTIE